MKTIIVATDFSSCAKNAAEYAAEMALSINADLHILHVYEIPVVYMEVPIAMTEEDMTASAEEAMNKLKQELLIKTNNKLNIETQIIIGRFYAELDSVCENKKPYAVVMGSQGTTAAERIFFGGHTVYAMQHLMWPLITVPQGAKFSAIKKIGFACDFNNIGETIPVDEIETMVTGFHAELHVLNTGIEKVYNPEIVFESARLKESLAGINTYYHFISSNDVDEGIIDFVKTNQIDLLIVIPKRHNLLDKIIHKSHTRQLVLHSHVPVMALHH